MECIICGKSTCQTAIKILESSNGERRKCETFQFDYLIDSSVLNIKGEKRIQAINLMTEFLLHTPICIDNGQKLPWHFYYSPSLVVTEPNAVNLYHNMKGYPKDIFNKADRILRNIIKLNSMPGIVFIASCYEYRLYFCESDSSELCGTEIVGLQEMLCQIGYINKHNGGYIISPKGWERAQYLSKHLMLNQAFVAMEFSERTDGIRESIRIAIESKGYQCVYIDEKHHNNQIVPEIFYEIGKSKYLVVDVTYGNLGAYYEAGYAQGIGKEVIVCCKKEVLNSTSKPHFDIAQIAMVVWEDYDDLTIRLSERIVATVGIGQNQEERTYE